MVGAYGDDRDLPRAHGDGEVDGRAGIPLRRAAAILGDEVQVDREKIVAGRRLPMRDERFAARIPDGVGGVDADRVEAIIIKCK